MYHRIYILSNIIISSKLKKKLPPHLYSYVRIIALFELGDSYKFGVWGGGGGGGEVCPQRPPPPKKKNTKKHTHKKTH